MKIVHGEIDHTKKTIKDSFSSEYDRKIFTLWANSHLNIVEKSKTLQAVYSEVLEINEENKGYSIFSQVFKLGRFLIQTEKTLFDSIIPQKKQEDLDTFAIQIRKNKFEFEDIKKKDIENIFLCLESGLINEGDIIQLLDKSSLELMDQIIRHGAETGRLSSPEKLEIFLQTILRLPQEQKIEIFLTKDPTTSLPLFTFISEKSISFIEEKFPELLDKSLNINSEDYLLIDNENYQKLIHQLDKLTKKSSINEFIKAEISEKLQKNERQEQRLLLQYVSPKELESIEKARKSALVSAISELIKKGEWMSLFKQNENNSEFSFLLVAAYCEKKISLEELATAMVFDGIYSHSPSTSKIYEMNEQNLKLISNENHNIKENKEWLEISQTIPKNLRFFMTSDAKSFDWYTDGTIKGSFFKKVSTPGVFEINDNGTYKYSMVSFGLAKAYYQKASSTTLVPILGLSPDRSLMIPRIRLNMSDFALFFRNSELIIHGSSNFMFGAMHDLLHTYARSIRVEVKDPFIKLAEAIENNVLLSFNQFKTKLDDGKEKLYPIFNQQPTKEEVIGYILDNISGDLVDGSYQPTLTIKDLSHGLQDAVDKIVDTHLKRTLSFLKEKQWDQDISYENIREEIHQIILVTQYLVKTSEHFK